MEEVINKQINSVILTQIVVLILIFFSYKKRIWYLLVLLCLFLMGSFIYGVVMSKLLLKEHIIVAGIVTGSSSTVKQGSRSWGYYFTYNGKQYQSSGRVTNFPNVNVDSVLAGNKYEVWVHPQYPSISEMDFSKPIK